MLRMRLFIRLAEARLLQFLRQCHNIFMRMLEFANGEIYHVYNRGVDKRNILSHRSDLRRYLVGLHEFNSIEPVGSLRNCERSRDDDFVPKPESKRLVDVLCYCLSKNHYHLILKQLVDAGISQFMQRWGTSCTKYFNTKYHRTGVLFQGKFKAVHIASNERLLELSVYVNLNNSLHAQTCRSPASAKLSKSSWDFYIQKSRKADWILTPDLILDQFKPGGDYKSFAEDCFSHLLERKVEDKELEQLMIED